MQHGVLLDISNKKNKEMEGAERKGQWQQKTDMVEIRKMDRVDTNGDGIEGGVWNRDS